MKFPSGAQPHDDRVISWVLITVGMLPVVTTLVRGTNFGAEPTIGLLMMVAGAATTVRALLPQARARHRNRER